jgi:hypothetical protein
MSNIGVLLRWTCAFVIAAVVYIIVFALGAVIWKQFGSDPLDTLQWSVALATTFAVISGTVILPREKWKAAALTLWLLALLAPFWFLLQSALSGRALLVNFVELGGGLIGGFIAFYSARIASSGRKINRVSRQG